MGWPALTSPSAQVLGGGGGDFPSIAWGLWRVSESLPHIPTWFEDIFSPQGAALLIADLPGAVLLAPLTALAGPVVSFNLLQALHLILAAAAAAALVGSARGGAAAGAALALSPAVLSSVHNGNPDVTPVFWIPLAALCAQRIPSRWGWTVLAGLSVGLSAWFSPYVGVMSALAALVFAPWRSPRSLVAGAIALGVAGVFALSVQATLEAGAAMVAKPPLDVRIPSPGAADLGGWVWPAIRAQPDGWSLHAWFPGASILLLAAAGWRAGWRWWALVALGVVLSLGPVLKLGPEQAAAGGGWLIALPGRWLQQLPLLSALHIQYRFAALAMVGLGVLAAAGIERLPRRAQWLAVGAVFAELCLWGAPLVAAGPAPAQTSCALLAPLGPGAVLDLPGEREERRMLAQTCHRRPIAEGLNQPYPNVVRQALRDGGLSALPAQGFRFVVFHAQADPMTPPAERAQADALLSDARAAGLIVSEADGVAVADLERLR